MLIITVNDLMQDGIVLGALGFFLEATLAVVSVPAVEPKAAIRSENSATGKAPRIIQLIMNFLAEFAILPSSCGYSLVLGIVELVNGA